MNWYDCTVPNNKIINELHGQYLFSMDPVAAPLHYKVRQMLNPLLPTSVGYHAGLLSNLIILQKLWITFRGIVVCKGCPSTFSKILKIKCSLISRKIHTSQSHVGMQVHVILPTVFSMVIMSMFFNGWHNEEVEDWSNVLVIAAC